MNNLILIDGNSLINRAYYATPPLSSKDGRPTNAVYAFVNMLVKLISEVKPEYILVAFDRKEPTFRHKMYADYKGTRKPMPDDLRPQVELLKTVLDEMKISRYECAGIEADDILGASSRKFPVNSIIVTGDKDSFQLVGEHTSVYFTKRGISDVEIYDNDNFTDKTGLIPKQIIDLKSLMGDSSDNIPGVSGVGEKTALNLVKTYGSLENLYANVETLTGKLKERIETSKDVAFLSKTLATIDTSVEIPLTLEDLKFDFPFSMSVKELFSELDFKNLIKKDALFAPDKISDKTEGKKSVEGRIIHLKNNDELPDFPVEKPLSVVFEKDFAVSDGIDEYVMKIPENFFDEGMSFENCISLIRPFFADNNRRIILWSKKAFKTAMVGFGFEFNARADDVSIQKYLADFSGKDDSLSDVIKEYGLDETRLATSLFSLAQIMGDKLKKEGLIDLYEDLELPLNDVLFDMEQAGFKIDRKTLSEMSADFEKRINELNGKIIDYAGENFNVNSTKQLGVILFEKLGLKSKKRNKTKTGYSTSADVLEEMKDEHPIIPAILEYRRIQKLYSTYVKGFEPLIDKKTGLVHTCFNQTLTSTGRLSSKEPNLQNIPVRDKEGKEIRKLFISSFDGGKIAGADYSQIELRLLAHFSGCKPLIETFTSGGDIHALTASQVFGVPLTEVTKEMRQSAKAVNFGIIYGISDYGLAEQLKISPKRAGEYIQKYFEMYPSVKEYMDGNVEFARKNGYVKTLLGRKRYIREINSSNYNLRSFGERAAMNMPLQGTAADIIKIAMLKVYNKFKELDLKSKLILQVHDELIVDAHPDEVGKVLEILKNEMQTAVTLSVPLTVETECGERWFDAK